jgi:hypothetical protein
MTTCLTTFSKDGFELYGHTMVDSWLKYWPENNKLIIYHEGFDIPQQDTRLIKLNLNEVSPDLLKFKLQSDRLSESAKTKKEKNRIFKTVKWCHKVYAMSHCLKNTDDDYVIFLDGDTYTVNDIPANFPKKLVDSNLFAVHFENLRNGLHFETGLVIFNNTHNKIKWFAEIFTSAYNSLDIYNMEKTWDGYWLANLYQKYRLPVKNLSENRNGVFNHPLVNKCLKHNVGTNKYLKAGYNEFTGRKI